jgi:parallel beta-helix repeat protein
MPRPDARVIAALALAFAALPVLSAELSVAPNGGGPGTNFASLSAAMAQLQPGDHLVVTAGTYRDALVFPQRNWGGAETIIEGRGKVLVKGSDVVEGWKSLGEGRFAKAWNTEPQQVFLDGQPLSQIGGTVFGGYPLKPGHPLAGLFSDKKGGIWPGRRDGNQDSMTANSFYYDRDQGTLLLQVALTDLAEHTVEVSTRPQLLYGNKLNNVTVRNISFQHSNTSTSMRGGMVTLLGQHMTLENIHADWADSAGMDINGDDIVIRNSSANNCGQVGMKVRGHRNKLIGNETNGNNTRGFYKWWEAGGAKFVGDGGLQDSQVIGHRALNNLGDGMWFDWKNRNNVIEHGFFAYNQGFGLQYEASDQATIVNNVVIGNDQRGVYLPHASNSVVAFNLISGNRMQGIALADEGRRDSNNEFDFSVKSNKVFGNVLAWNDGPMILPDDLADNLSDDNLYVGDDQQANPGKGWGHVFRAPLKAWTQQTHLDAGSQRIDMPMDAKFKRSIDERRQNPDLTWYQTLRARSKPMQIDPALMKLVPGITDTRPGPTL